MSECVWESKRVREREREREKVPLHSSHDFIPDISFLLVRENEREREWVSVCERERDI